MISLGYAYKFSSLHPSCCFDALALGIQAKIHD